MSVHPDRIQSEPDYEDQHVHQVYDSIASHFSSTRFKPWPVVDSFLRALPPGSIGLDIGCGNGKYLGVRTEDVFIVASDRSTSLLTFARRHPPHDAAVLADTLALPHPTGVFDFAISIAVVHHLSSRDRRREAVRSILATLKDRGRGQALLFVWALEQKGSRRGWDAGMEQDVLVPWVLKNSESSPPHQAAGTEAEEKVFQRYYHLYRQGELEEDIEAVGGTVVRNGYDRDNWWAVCARQS